MRGRVVQFAGAVAGSGDYRAGRIADHRPDGYLTSCPGDTGFVEGARHRGRGGEGHCFP